jgi:hypothetical protein
MALSRSETLLGEGHTRRRLLYPVLTTVYPLPRVPTADRPPIHVCPQHLSRKGRPAFGNALAKHPFPTRHHPRIRPDDGGLSPRRGHALHAALLSPMLPSGHCPLSSQGFAWAGASSSSSSDPLFRLSPALREWVR